MDDSASPSARAERKRRREMEIIEARTKSGKAARVLVLTATELSPSIEARAYEAAERATEHGCAHWRIVDPATAAVIQVGKAGAPTLTRDQAAAQSGPREDRHDW